MKSRRSFCFDEDRAHFISKNHLPTPEEILETFPTPLVVVLDFALKNGAIPGNIHTDQKNRYVAASYSRVARSGNLQTALNIDHHNEPSSRIPNFSTTHQVISARNMKLIYPGKREQVAIINHDDTDSILSLLLATHPDVPQRTQEVFATAARSADHTGEPNALVNLIDAFYNQNRLPELVVLISLFLEEKPLVFPSAEIREQHEALSRQPEIIQQYLCAIMSSKSSPYGEGFFDPQSGILSLEPKDRSINTIRLLPHVEKLRPVVKLIMVSWPLQIEENWWKIALRATKHFRSHQTLESIAKKLQLQQFGYGGRRNAGGIGRHRGEQTITPNELCQILRPEM